MTMTTPTVSYELDEHEMFDGITWIAEFSNGRIWTIVWQYARTGDNMRAWPVTGALPGRTKHWGHAVTPEAARTEAHKLAETIAGQLAASR
jgi:hypothetical protein